jgi:hypothetical protein
MIMEKEMIIKALECCANNDECVGEACPYYATGCEKQMPKDALSLIKELTEENERLRGRHQWDWTKFYCNGRKGVCDIGNWINGSCEGCWYYDGKGGHYLYESTRERKERNV